MEGRQTGRVNTLSCLMMTIALEDDDDDTCAEFELGHECVRQSHMARVAVDDRQCSHIPTSVCV